jgi:hypothetical protein
MTISSAVRVGVLSSVALFSVACGGGGSSPSPEGCTSPSQCPGTDTACSARTCVGGVCGTESAPVGTFASDPVDGDCRADLCDGAGGIDAGAVDDTDLPSDDTTCTTDTCTAGTAAHVPAPIQTACTDGGGQVCDGTGSCVLVCDVSNPCTSAPPPACAGEIATTYASPGTCAAEAGDPGYACTYAPATTDCAAMALVCDAGACVTALATTAAQLEAVRDAAVACGAGPCAASLAVDRAVVTYARPAIGSEPAAFFLQAASTGPAVLVDVDPATLATPLAAGDRVSLVVTGVATGSGGPFATSVSDVVRDGQGVDVAPLVQDLSAASDVVTALDAYVHELVVVEGTLSGAASASGTGFVSFPLATAGLPSEPGLRFRVATSVQDALDVVAGCTLRSGPAPLGRFNAQAQPTARAIAELALLACPAPRVVSAVALDATTARITFDRHLDPASVAADGSQVSFGGGLVASSATADGRVLTVTTSPQSAGATYTVTVAGTVRDLLGAGIDPVGASATFAGFTVRAVVRLTELSPNILSSRDLVELLVIEGGTTAGGQLLQIGTVTDVLATFPDATVAAGDVIVVHLAPDSTNGDAPASETTAKDQHPAAAYAANYDTAWDFHGGTLGLTFSNRVIRVVDGTGQLQDAVPFVLSTGTPPAAFPAALQALQAEGRWLPADCGGQPCTYTSTPTAIEVSVDYLGCGTTRTGDTVQRVPGMDNRTRTDWLPAGAHSLGLPNP